MTDFVKKFIEDILDREFYFDKKEDGIYYQEIY